ncbi:hypothetical protein KKC17_04405 [Patescibacteria group bacterium]|nr:hypothetical protein [Patescibacteria group bacterium]
MDSKTLIDLLFIDITIVIIVLLVYLYIERRRKKIFLYGKQNGFLTKYWGNLKNYRFNFSLSLSLSKFKKFRLPKIEPLKILNLFNLNLKKLKPKLLINKKNTEEIIKKDLPPPNDKKLLIISLYLISIGIMSLIYLII